MRRTRPMLRVAVLFLTVSASLVTAASRADAAVSSSSSMTVPVASAVGNSGLAGSITVRNINTPPNQSETNTVNQLRLAPSCGSAPVGANPCPTPDTGVFSVAPSASGAAGTACAGVTFTASAPDAAGIVSFSSPGAVVLAPPGGAAGSDRCTVNFTYSTLKLPTIDVDPPTPGAQTFTNARTQSTSSGGQTVSNSLNVMVTVVPALGGSTVADFGNDGRTDFALFRPSTGTWLVRNSTGPDQITPWGTNGDVAVAGDYNANGAADRAVFRPSSGMWFVQGGPTAAWGTSGDVPVPADYDGNGATDIAVFRPSTGTWYVSGGGAAVVWGTSGDVAVPGDYNGNGTDERAVYRPSTAAWYVQGGTTTIFGTAGDIPVPGDYDGNGTTDIAVFRPSTGIWYVQGSAAVAWGTSGDIPVPGDYDGNGTTDRAVFRKSTGTWYVQGGSATVWGASGDVPVALPPAIRAIVP